MLISERSVLDIVYWPMSNHLLPILLNSDGEISLFLELGFKEVSH